MRTRNTCTLTAALLISIAGHPADGLPGFGLSAWQPAGAAAVKPGVEFRSIRWLSDRKVVNAANEEIASVSDLIMDRGSGRIEFAVVKTGSTMGLGGKSVAVPYASLQWSPGNDRFTLATTQDQLKQFPEFSAEAWAALKSPGKDDSSALRRRLSDESQTVDPYAGALDTAKKVHIEGEVKKVERVRTTAFGEQVIITVAAKDGSTHRVALGPSWYINGADVVPMRGDTVVVEALDLPRDPDQLSAARSVKVGDREIHLRASDGTPEWALKSTDKPPKYSAAHYRYALAGQIPGMKVDCRGQECGKVFDLIVDRPSGEVAFVSIDPNKNFLGIADTKRLVPWSIVSFGVDGAIRLDASKDMILASIESPSDPATLSGDRAAAVYDAYQVPAPCFDPPKSVAPSAINPPGAWSARGVVISSVDRSSAQTISGKVAGMTEVKFGEGIQSALAVRIKSGDDEQVVLLGPVWYMENQKLNLEPGDQISADAVRTTIDGKAYWIARTIQAKGAKTVLLESGDRPVWDKH